MNDTARRVCSQTRERRSIAASTFHGVGCYKGRGGACCWRRQQIVGTDDGAGPTCPIGHAMADSVKHVFVTGGNAGSMRPCLPLIFARYLSPLAS